ncbi:hypothetical protein CYLTODRAFT_440636 [Cylindrobasidium torrendii FP15055 ss-10]|uniref:Uncharacterized protein n=1 Tax=Cylindrobasidium torrendii FP15055 ss-10 TaxID=1314674 RepID=A0A0D7BS01_9AGAR|nr:hypothetical protein CYLTODRAFT_440636 [Cylindrobasidium torrendii FP15055 ss-10]
MQLLRSLFVLTVASFCAASALPDISNLTYEDLQKRAVQCETSGGSPSTADAIRAAQHIRDIDVHADPGHTECCQNNQGGSLCTTMYCTGSACVGICSQGALQFPGCMLCNEAGNGLLDIANRCSSGGKSGGRADAPYNLHLILFHS